MRQRISIGIMLFCMILTLSPVVYAAEEKQLVYDYAGVFSDSELERLDQQAREMSSKKGLDILIVFIQEGLDSQEMEQFADDFYDQGAFGYEEPHGTGILMAVDVKSRKYHFSTSGGAEDYFTNSRFDDLEDEVVDELKDNDWYDAGQEFIRFMNQFRDPNRPVSMSDRVMASVSRLPVYLVIAAAGSGITVWIMVKNRSARVTVNDNTYLYPGSFALVQQDDIFVREHTARTRIPRGGNGGGSGGGGGGHHTSSGGFSHGGRGGSF